MPTIWFAKDGVRPHTQQGNGITITQTEAQEIFSGNELHYVGDEAPNIRPDTPSKHPTNVVIQLEVGEPTSKIFPLVGFYIIQNATPEHVEQCIIKIRKSG